MSQFCEDKTQIAIYPDGIFAEERGALCIRCLQWGDDLQEEERNHTLPTAQALVDTAQGSKAALRVAFLPIIPKVDAKDLDTDETEDFRTLVKHFQIPSAVLAERMRSVGYSFGSKSYRDRSEIAWSHFLCRNVILSEDNVIEDLGYLDHGNDNGKMPSPNEMWTMCDFFLHTSPHATLETDGGRNVTLLCFGAPEQVVRRFHRLQNEDAWHDVRDQPYLLFDIIYDELHQLFDSAVAKLRQAVKPQEKAALERAGSHASSQEAGLDLQSLHNIQKNCIFMIEAAEASIATLQAMSEKIRRSRKDSLSLEVADAIEYRRRSFHSTLLRSHSLEKRMTNVIQLSFNLITQADSTILKFDSKAMRLSASMTFAFLPLTGVATLFSTPFFDINWDGPESPEREGRVFRVSTTFWIFWCVAFPLTLFVVVSGAFAINHTKDFGERIASSFVDIVKYGRVRRKSRALEKDDVGNGNV